MCNLCGSNLPLKQSHIIPRFIGKWMKDTAFTPYIRFGMDIEKRHQDLLKLKLLCGECENRISAWETKFANEVFYPTVDGKTTFRYRDWFVKFAASLSWRALQHRRLLQIEEPPDLNVIFDDMEVRLKSYLLGTVKHLGPFTQHVYPVSELAEPIEPGSPMLNRYLARAVEIDYIRNDDFSEVMVYVKLPMFMFLSIGASKYRKWFETSRIKKSGKLWPKHYILETGMLDYLLERANRMHELLNSMSPKSKAVAEKAVSKAIRDDPERVANSRQMRAMLADYEFYGEDAVVYRD